MRVLLVVDSTAEHGEQVLASLSLAGIDVVAVAAESDDLYALMEQHEPHAVIIDAESPARDTLEHLASLALRNPKPMIMLAEGAGEDFQEPVAAAAMAAEFGVSAYVVDSLSPGLIRSLIEVGVAQFQSYQLLKSELRKTQEALEQRKLVDRAKCLVMEREQLNEAAAYNLLRKLAMDRRQSLSAVATAVISAKKTSNG